MRTLVDVHRHENVLIAVSVPRFFVAGTVVLRPLARGQDWQLGTWD